MEPKDYGVHDFVLSHFYDLKFSPAVATEEQRTSENPKRRQRTARKRMQETGIGTKSQQALQLQLEANKTKRKHARNNNAKQRGSDSSTSNSRSAKRNVEGIRQEGARACGSLLIAPFPLPVTLRRTPCNRCRRQASRSRRGSPAM